MQPLKTTRENRSPVFSRVCKIYVFILISLTGNLCCAGETVIEYTNGDLNQKKVQIITASLEKIMAMPAVLKGGDLKLSPRALIKSAQTALKSYKPADVQTENWLTRTDSKKLEPGSPFLPGTNSPIVSWHFVEGTFKEIDFGAVRESPSSWKPRLSGRIWWKLRFMGINAKGSSQEVVTVALLQDGTVIYPEWKPATKSEISKMKQEATGG